MRLARMGIGASMKVIRCEHFETMRGPYRAKNIWDLEKRFPWVMLHNNKRHPTPEMDGIPNMNDLPRADLHGFSFQCGFKNISQAKAWFTERQRLDCKSKGFRFYWFDTKDAVVMFGKHQLVFERAKAKRLNEVEEL
jgi:hypothetical protein